MECVQNMSFCQKQRKEIKFWKQCKKGNSLQMRDDDGFKLSFIFKIWAQLEKFWSIWDSEWLILRHMAYAHIHNLTGLLSELSFDISFIELVQKHLSGACFLTTLHSKVQYLLFLLLYLVIILCRSSFCPWQKGYI